MKMPKIARLAEQTVQDAERHAAVHSKRRPRTGGARRNGPVTEAQVRDDIMETARRLVTPGITRVRIVSATEVIIENLPIARQQ